MVSRSQIASQVLTPLLIAIFALLWDGPRAKAHELTPAVADFSFEGGEVHFRIEMNLEAALAKIGPEHDDTGDSPQAGEYEALRALNGPALTKRLRTDEAGFLGEIDVQAGGAQVPLTLNEIEVLEQTDPELARFTVLSIAGDLPDGAQSMTFGWASHYGAVVLRSESDVDSEGFAAFLAAGDISDPIPVTVEHQSLWSGFMDFISRLLGRS